MKIRIKGNSVRLRLTKTEVDIFCSTGRFTEETRLPNGTFTYTLAIKEDIDAMDALLQQNGVTLYISKELVTDWATDDRVGFQHALPLENDTTLSLLVEKDFVCMDQRIEDQSDNYPNPKLLGR